MRQHPLDGARPTLPVAHWITRYVTAHPTGRLRGRPGTLRVGGGGQEDDGGAPGCADGRRPGSRALGSHVTPVRLTRGPGWAGTFGGGCWDAIVRAGRVFVLTARRRQAKATRRCCVGIVDAELESPSKASGPKPLDRQDPKAAAARFAPDGEYTDVETPEDDVARGPDGDRRGASGLAFGPLTELRDERRHLLVGDDVIMTEHVEHWAWPTGETMALARGVGTRGARSAPIYTLVRLLGHERQSVAAVPQWWFEHVLVRWIQKLARGAPLFCSVRPCSTRTVRVPRPLWWWRTGVSPPSELDSMKSRPDQPTGYCSQWPHRDAGHGEQPLPRHLSRARLEGDALRARQAAGPPGRAGGSSPRAPPTPAASRAL